MKKFMETVKVFFKSQLAYRFDVFINMIFSISKIILAYVLWSAVYGQKNEIGGFTFHAMLSYYIINPLITQLDQSNGTGWQIANEIKHGTFSKYMVRPMGIFGYFTAQTGGVSLFLLSFNLIASFVWIFLFGIEFVITSDLSNILFAIVFTLLGLLFMMQMNYYIGILAFRFVDTSIFMMIKENLIQFITGGLIPLTLFPEGIIRIMSWLPFYYVSYLPTMLLLGRGEDEIPLGILVLLLWNGSFAVLNRVSFNRLKIKYDGVGI